MINKILPYFVQIRAAKPLSLFFFISLGLLFSTLPWRYDYSLFCVLAFLLGLLAFLKQSKSAIAPFEKLSLILLGVYTLLATFSLIANFQYASYYIRVLLWIICFLTGFSASKALQGHAFKFVFFLVASLLISALAGIFWNFVEPDKIFLYHRLRLFLASPSRLSLITSLGYFYCLHLFFCNTHKIVSFLMAAACLVILDLTGARLSIIAVMATTVLLILFYRANKLKTVLSLGIIILLAGFTLFSLITEHKPTARLISGISNPIGDRNFQSRTVMWDAGVEAIADSPLTGHGFRSYKKIYEDYVAKNRNALLAEKQPFDDSSKQVHNIYMGRAIETGIPSALVFYLLYLAITIKSLKASIRTGWLGCFFIYYLITGLLDDGLYRLSDSFIFVLLGAVAAYRPPEDNTAPT